MGLTATRQEKSARQAFHVRKPFLVRRMTCIGHACLTCRLSTLSTHNRGSQRASPDLIKSCARTKGPGAVNSVCLAAPHHHSRDFDITRATDNRGRKIILQLGPTVTAISCGHGRRARGGARGRTLARMKGEGGRWWGVTVTER